MKKILELFERLWGGRLAANIVIKCSTQVFLRVWLFGFSLQPPKRPENVFSKCGGLSSNEPSNVRTKIFFEENDAAFTNAHTGNNRTAQPPVSLSNVAFSVLDQDSLPDTCTATWSFFSVSSLSPSPASSSSCLPPLFVAVFLYLFGLLAFTFFFLALGAGTPSVADATAAAFLHYSSVA